MDKPVVSVIIPCLNEEKYIGECLDSVIANDYPKDSLEVLVVDGMSSDRTREILKDYEQRHPFVHRLDNPRKIIPAALNVGIKASRGEIIMRLDAHTTYTRDYLSKCVMYLNQYNADSVGGILKTVPQYYTIIGMSISFSLSHPFGIGNAYFRFVSGKPRWVDTAPFFCCKKEAFDKVGLFNENVIYSEDMEFFSRLRRAGGKILLVPDIVSYYHARSDYASFCKHHFRNGVWVVLPLLYSPYRSLSLRHFVPLVFVLGLVVSLGLSLLWQAFFWLVVAAVGLYMVASLVASFQIAFRQRDLRYFFLMPVTFLVLHLSYGAGSMWGLIRLLGSSRFWRKLFGNQMES